MTPVNGQGMNTGVQDVYNLAWKLERALAGASPEVLDSYEHERRPVAIATVQASGQLHEANVLTGDAAAAPISASPPRSRHPQRSSPRSQQLMSSASGIRRARSSAASRRPARSVCSRGNASRTLLPCESCSERPNCNCGYVPASKRRVRRSMSPHGLHEGSRRSCSSSAMHRLRARPMSSPTRTYACMVAWARSPTPPTSSVPTVISASAAIRPMPTRLPSTSARSASTRPRIAHPDVLRVRRARPRTSPFPAGRRSRCSTVTRTDRTIGSDRSDRPAIDGEFRKCCSARCHAATSHASRRSPVLAVLSPADTPNVRLIPPNREARCSCPGCRRDPPARQEGLA